ncbi:MAG: PilZ domain-containing protein [Terriglobia bacterium]
MATRRATRVRPPTATQVGFVGTDSKFTARLVDFSPFGLSVKTSREVPIGSIFRLAIQVGADYFRAAAAVRAKIPGGFAAEFLSMTAIDREMMRRLYLRLQIASRDRA